MLPNTPCTHTHCLNLHQLFLINLQNSFCCPALSENGPQIQRKKEVEEKDFLFLLANLNSHIFLTKSSRVAETIHPYLQELGEICESLSHSLSLLLGHIPPITTENTACKAALCCKEIVLPVAAGGGLTFVPLPIMSSLQTPNKPLFHHSLWHSCGGGPT